MASASAQAGQPIDDQTKGQQSMGDNDNNNKLIDTIVQYIIVRTDLKWNSGATIAQACHASTAAIVTTLEHQSTKDYLADLNNMHKIVLKADSLQALEDCQRKLDENKISHHLWLERPENILTCLAVSPQPRSLVKAFFSHLKLLK